MLFQVFFKQVYSEICSPNHEKINGENQSCSLLLKLNFFRSILTANFRTLFVVNLFINSFINFLIDLFKSFGHKFLNTSISMLSFITKLYVSEWSVNWRRHFCIFESVPPNFRVNSSNLLNSTLCFLASRFCFSSQFLTFWNCYRFSIS